MTQRKTREQMPSGLQPPSDYVGAEVYTYDQQLISIGKVTPNSESADPQTITVKSGRQVYVLQRSKVWGVTSDKQKVFLMMSQHEWEVMRNRRRKST